VPGPGARSEEAGRHPAQDRASTGPGEGAHRGHQGRARRRALRGPRGRGDAADGDHRQRRDAAAARERLEADDGRVALLRRREVDRTDGDVIGAPLAEEIEELRLGVARGADEHALPRDLAHERRRQIGLAHVHPVGVARDAQVRSIVDDEGHGGTTTGRPHGFEEREHLAIGAGLQPQLDHGDAAGDELCDRTAELLGLLVARRIDGRRRRAVGIGRRQDGVDAEGDASVGERRALGRRTSLCAAGGADAVVERGDERAPAIGIGARARERDEVLEGLADVLLELPDVRGEVELRQVVDAVAHLHEAERVVGVLAQARVVGGGGVGALAGLREQLDATRDLGAKARLDLFAPDLAVLDDIVQQRRRPRDVIDRDVAGAAELLDELAHGDGVLDVGGAVSPLLALMGFARDGERAIERGRGGRCGQGFCLFLSAGDYTFDLVRARPVPSALFALAGLLAVQLALGAACPPRKDTTPDGVRNPAEGAAPDLASPPVFAPQPAGKRVAVVYTASVQGYVEPCGCTGDPLGGVARLAALLADARKAYGERVLFVDAGDLLFEHLDDTAAADQCQASARADLLTATYARLGLAATTLGPLDDVRGASFRDARLAAHRVPTVGVGLPRPLVEGAQALPSILRELGPARIGVTALRLDEPSALDTARAALGAEVEKLRTAGADTVIVLAQSPRELTRRALGGLAGVDLVIQGRAPGEVPAAPEVLDSGAVLVASGMQAQFAGVLELVLDGRTDDKPLALDDRRARGERRLKVLELRLKELKGQIEQAPEGPRRQFLEERFAAAEAEVQSIRAADTSAPLLEPHIVARAVPLPRGFAEEPAAKKALEAYTASIPSLVASCEASMSCPEPAPGARTYVGVEACKGCHQPAVDFWRAQASKLPGKDASGKPIVRTVGHAHAWETLVADGRDKDRSCVGCHSVGFGEEGGACRTTDIVKRGLAAVQCESCHGPGSLHATTGKAADIVRFTSEASCRACHHVPHIPTTESFVFEERLKRVLGPGHGDKKRAEPSP
jgi:hypothetical protein